MNLKKVIIILIICIIIVLTMLLIILGWNKENISSNELPMRPISNEEYTDYLENTEFAKVNKLYDSTTFFTITSCIDKYIGYNLQKDSQKLYNILSEEFINKKGITVDNILNKITIYNNESTFSAKKIYEYNNNDSISTYFVYGKVIEDTYANDNPKKQDLNIVVQLDKVNRTFYIILDEKEADNGIGKNTEIVEIKNNIVNQYITPKVADTQIGMLYLSDYKEKMLEDLNTAYTLLDEEYKEKRYNTIDKFKKYISSIDVLNYISSVDCKVTKQDENNVYRLKDQYGNVYIIKETAIMEYTIQLDDYTLENEEFNKNYNTANSRDKGILNIDKFFKMINMQDYTSAYSVLDNNFKQNYFKTQIDFENYMKNKVFRYNKVDYKEYSNKITDIYTYKVVLTDLTEENTNEVEFNIVMKLLEGTDFVMSFAVN